METPHSLQTLAEVAVTLAGFTALIAVFKRASTWSRSEVIRILAAIGLCFCALTAALLPEALSYFTSSDAIIWGIPILVAGLSIIPTNILVLYRSYVGTYTFSTRFGKALTSIQFPVCLVWILGSMDVLVPRSPGTLILAVLYVIFLVVMTVVVSILQLVRDEGT
jgi:hypothetical protein